MPRPLRRHHLGRENVLGRAAWGIVQTLLFRPTPRPFHHWRAWLLRAFGARIGRNVRIYATARVWAPWQLTMEDDSCLGDHVDCYCVERVTLGRGAIVSQYGFLCTASHDFEIEGLPLVAAPITIEADAWVTADVFVGPGVTIGEGAVVLARSSVVHDLPQWQVCAGTPARPLRPRRRPGPDPDLAVSPGVTTLETATGTATSGARDEALPATPTTPTPPLRVAIQQPSLPRYRLPLYQHLARRPDVDLTLYYGSEEPALRNVEPEGFAGHLVPFRSVAAGPLGPLFWHRAQWGVTGPATADVAILCWNARFLSLLPALVRARLAGVPTALWGHGFSKAEASWRARLRWLPARLANALIFYDFNTARQWARDGLAEAKIFVAPNGLDSTRIDAAIAGWRANPGRLERFRTDELPDSGPVLAYIGRIQPANRLDLAIDALADLASTHPGARLVVIGNGDPVADLKRQAETLGVGERIHWVGERYDEAEVAPWLLSADLMVYPANVGLSLIHGFNYGLPVLACAPRAIHNPEIWALDDGRNGILCESLDGAAIATAARAIVDDPARHQAMRDAARASARDTYNLDAVGRTFDRLIDYLAARR